MELLYKVKDRPKAGNLLAFALQQLLLLAGATLLGAYKNQKEN